MRLDLFPPAHSFAEFYNSRVVWSVGSRISVTELRDAYVTWATEHRSPSLSFREFRREMIARGHRHIYSNGARYLDARLLAAGEATAEHVAAPTGSASAPADILDWAIAALIDLREALR